MSPRFWIMGSAIGAGVLILLLAVITGGKAKPRAEATHIAPIDDTAPTMDESIEVDRDLAVRKVEGINFVGRAGNEQRIHFSADQAQPQDDGVMIVTRPRTLIHQQGGQVTEILADRGRVVAPDNNLRRGDLTDNVTVTLYAPPSPDTPDAPVGRRKVRARIKLVEAHVDIDLNEVTSADDVVVEGERFKFVGRGLTLNYNELYSRIDRLVIDQGEYLHLYPAGDVVEAHSPRDDDAPAPEQVPPQDPAEIDYYEARFEDQVTIRSTQVDAGAESLKLIFSELMFSGQAGPANTASQSSDSPPQIDRQPVDGAGKSEANRVVVTWSGKLVVKPLEGPPHDMESPHDVIVALAGRPARIATTEGDTIVAEQVSYSPTAQHLHVQAMADSPFKMSSQQMGTLTGQTLRINQRAGTGTIKGPGKLVTPSRWQHAPQDELTQLAGGWTRMPADMTVDWSRGVDMTFFTTDPADSTGLVQRMPALRTIIFMDDVHVRDPSFSLDARRVGIGLEQPIDGKQSPHSITAEGDVEFSYSAGRDGRPPLSVGAQSIDLEAKVDADGKPQPTHLLAEGRVSLAQPGRKMHTGWLDAVLAPGADGEIEPVQIEARKTVRIEFTEDDDTYVVSADWLKSDKAKDKTELFGTADEPARIRRGKVELEAGYIIMKEEAQVMHVTGPGQWKFRQSPETGDDAERIMTVTWADSMHYDHNSGKAVFKGKVKTAGQSDLDTTSLTSDRLQLSIDDAEQEPGELTQIRRVKELIAKGNVVFLSTKWKDKIDGKIATRLLIKGPRMVFENNRREGMKVEQIRFEDKGNLMFEDYRSQQAGDDDGDEKTQIKLSGQGVTAFDWDGQLQLDALHNDMRISENVWMVHNPLDESSSVQIECDSFVADLAETGGLDNWTSGQAPQLDIKAVTARGGVVVTRDNEQIHTDQLKYTRRKEVITLTADRGSRTIVKRDDKILTSTTKPLHWNRITKTYKGGPMSPIRLRP